MPSLRPLVVHCTGPTEATISGAEPPPLRAGGHYLYFSTLATLAHRMERYLPLLDAHESARAARFRFAQDRARFILGHGLLREVLGRHVEQPPEALLFHRGEFGKPFLAGHPVHFNLSDTKDAVLVAVACGPVGADIETLNRSTDHERVAGHYFTPPEVESIAQAPDGKRRFLELWTRKEAVLKACGVGLMDDLHSLEVNGAHNRMQISHPAFARLAAPEYHVGTFTAGPHHLISLASAAPITQLLVVAA
ncbi:MAG: 4'-phosphopantetheinyl transferase superfamily protein [Flavobacteriales bacterium]|nr:4'-phosphopantetheinyl transferase superfamily protein [Flavobacteriales bacterium]MBP9078624.1 4'-phosphopantetheinyl transferase superfamily protein [Flavobacteriales bacterium]